jgi:hypothetical protein
MVCILHQPESYARAPSVQQGADDVQFGRERSPGTSNNSFSFLVPTIIRLAKQPMVYLCENLQLFFPSSKFYRLVARLPWTAFTLESLMLPVVTPVSILSRSSAAAAHARESSGNRSIARRQQSATLPRPSLERTLGSLHV